MLLGLPSSGPHSNGFSLIRRIVAHVRADLRQPAEGVAGFATLGHALPAPTPTYAQPVLALLPEVPAKGMAALPGARPTATTHRMCPDGCTARIERSAWPRPAVFDWLQRSGNVDDAGMFRVFNCGIGLVLVVAAADADRAQALLAGAGETVHRIGIVERQDSGKPQTRIV